MPGKFVGPCRLCKPWPPVCARPSPPSSARSTDGSLRLVRVVCRAAARTLTRLCPDPGEDHERMLATGLITQAALPANVNKSRYCNIMPYDSNRVVLRTHAATSTDFINASYVRFEGLPGETIIATQGPLHPDWHGPDTCGACGRRRPPCGVRVRACVCVPVECSPVKQCARARVCVCVCVHLLCAVVCAPSSPQGTSGGVCGRTT